LRTSRFRPSIVSVVVVGSIRSLVSLSESLVFQQLRQLRKVRRDPARLVVGEELGRPSPATLLLRTIRRIITQAFSVTRVTALSVTILHQ
jgi:hypothetical protein